MSPEPHGTKVDLVLEDADSWFDQLSSAGEARAANRLLNALLGDMYRIYAYLFDSADDKGDFFRQMGSQLDTQILDALTMFWRGGVVHDLKADTQPKHHALYPGEHLYPSEYLFPGEQLHFPPRDATMRLNLKNADEREAVYDSHIVGRPVVQIMGKSLDTLRGLLAHRAK